MRRFDPMDALARERHEFGEHGGVNPSVEASSTFTVMHPETMPRLFHGERKGTEGCYLYGRHLNPTVAVLGRQLAAMEATRGGYCTSSGMAAIASVVMQLTGPGDHAVASHTIYGGTFALLNNYMPAHNGTKVSFVDASDLHAVEAAMTERTRFLYVETLANPTLEVADLPGLARIAHSYGIPLIVDNTFCPVVCTPARWGADIVIHSLTKFVSGSSDLIAGAVCADTPFIEQLMDVNGGSFMLLGPTMDPFVAEKLSLRMPHLGIRMAEHGRRAQVFAERLEALGVPVVYPGLESHPQHRLARKLMNAGYGMGGMLDLDLGTRERAEALMDMLQNELGFGFMAVSLGYFDSLVTAPAESISSEMSDEAQTEAGISPGLIRLSIGYTGSLETRWAQMLRGLRALGVEKAAKQPA